MFWPPLQVNCFVTTVSGVDHNSDNLIFLVYRIRSLLVTIWIMDFMCTSGKDTKMSFSFRYFSLSHQDKKQVVKGNDRAAPQKWEGWSQVWDREGCHSWTKISFLGSSRPSCNVLPTRPTREECFFIFLNINLEEDVDSGQILFCIFFNCFNQRAILVWAVQTFGWAEHVSYAKPEKRGRSLTNRVWRGKRCQRDLTCGLPTVALVDKEEAASCSEP